MAVDAVVYYRISNATIAITNVEDYGHSTRLLAATTLRNVLGTKNLSEILSERESISHVMQVRSSISSTSHRSVWFLQLLAADFYPTQGIRVLLKGKRLTLSEFPGSRWTRFRERRSAEKKLKRA